MMYSQHLQVPVLPQVLGSDNTITAQSVLTEVNLQRSKENIAPLEWNTLLAQAAENKAQDMLAKDYWSHATPEGKQPWSFIDATNYQYRVAGENLARNFSSSSSVVKAWMNSPSHRANLLQPVYQETGIATVTGKMNGQETTLVVQMFGTPNGELSTVARRAPEPTPRPGEVSDNASNISRWLASETVSPPAQFPSFSRVLGVTSPQASLFWYRLGMGVILCGALLLLLMDAHHPRYRKKKTTHPLLRPSKHTLHVALLIGTLVTLAIAETGALL